MDLTFLGTASAFPSPSRGVSCIALRHETGVWLFDCGESSQVQIMRSHIKAGKVCRIFITHLHGDHLFGLPGLMCTISQSNQRHEPLHLYGPEGLRKYVRTSLELSRSELTYNYVVHELKVMEDQLPLDWKTWTVDHSASDDLHINEKKGSLIHPTDGIWQILDNDMFKVQAVALRHRVPSFGYIVEEKPRQGKLNTSILMEKGIPPGPLYGKIKAGEIITSPNGELVRPEDVLSPSLPGRRFALFQDTTDMSDSEPILRAASGVDLLIHEATLENRLREKAEENGHSTPGIAAHVAQVLRAGHLVITHYSQRYRGLEQEIKNGQDSAAILLHEAEEAFGQGKVTLAEDFLTIPVPQKSSLEQDVQPP